MHSSLALRSSCLVTASGLERFERLAQEISRGMWNLAFVSAGVERICRLSVFVTTQPGWRGSRVYSISLSFCDDFGLLPLL